MIYYWHDSTIKIQINCSDIYEKILFILFCLDSSTFYYSFDESYGTTVGIGAKDSIIGGIDNLADGGIGFI